jgi:hypothetical protein
MIEMTDATQYIMDVLRNRERPSIQEERAEHPISIHDE